MTRLAALALLACLPLLPRQAAAQDVLALVRADRWAEADAAAAKYLDPVARKLVTWYRLQTPSSSQGGAASVSEIDAFMAQNPDWPGQVTLARRREEALAAEPDDSIALGFCARLTPHGAAALLRCAEALKHDNQSAAAIATARQAWVGGGITDPGAETRFMKEWGDSITPADQWHRFDHLAWSDPTTAARQITRLDATHKRAAEARLALRRGDAKAPALLSALPPDLRADPTLFLDEAKRLRATNQNQAAFALWQAAGSAAQSASPDHLGAFWSERSQLARVLLQQGDATAAYALAANAGQTDPETRADAEFLAGWIALRRLSDPGSASQHFLKVVQSSQAAITQSRGHYWLGRALTAQNEQEAARAEYTAAANWPTTYYGQLAALALGDDPAALNTRIESTRDPDWTSQQAVAFASREIARAAELLVAWGESYRARPFLLRLQELGPDPADQAMAARLSLGFGMPDEAVTIARRAGRDGVMLADIGWPETTDPPPGPIDPALTLGVIRQESSFDTAATSPAGARGLMQLMPGTASDVARKLGLQITPASLTLDPDQNMRLGTTYLQGLLDQFTGVLPLAVAAYNAGPGRVQQWLASLGDPRTGQIDMIDWIELIPFNETRNYVQRVTENTAIYRARHGTTAPHPLAPWRG